MGMLLVLFLLLFSCSPVIPVDQTEVVMLTNTLSIEAVNLRKSDFWNIAKQIRKKDIMEAIAQYLQDGYEIVDAPTSGTIDLTGLTITGKKALVVWRDAPTGRITINLTNTMSDSVGALDNVVILGAQLNAQNQLENPGFYTTRVQISIDTTGGFGSDYSKKLKLNYLFMDLDQSGGALSVQGIDVYNCDIRIENTVGYGTGDNYYYDGDWVNNKVLLNQWYGAFKIISLNQDVLCDDNHIYHRADYQQSCGVEAINTNTLTLQNTYIVDVGPVVGRFGIYTYLNGKVNIQNVLFENCRGDLANADSDNLNYINIKNSSLTSGVSYKNILVSWTGDVDQGEIYSGKNVFDSAVISDDSSNLKLDAIVVQQRNSIRGELGTIKRTFYSLQFQEDYLMDEALKYFDDNDYLRIKRTQEMDVFVYASGGAKKIKNLVLYENDGTTFFDYRNDENFLILAEDASGNEAWFAWYKGSLKTTVLSDVWNDTEYSIKYCFQIWRTPANISYRNVMPDPDSGLSGSIIYQDMTSIFVIP